MKVALIDIQDKAKRSNMICLPKVSIIILNWNNFRDTIRCLESVYKINYPLYNVIVIDNGSTDDSVIEIMSYCKDKLSLEVVFQNYDLGFSQFEQLFINNDVSQTGTIKNKIYIIKNQDNYGYAVGNNVGIIYALGNFDIKYVLILNNDIIVDKNFLLELVISSEGEEQIGIAGPKIFYNCVNKRRDIINFAGGVMKMWRGKPCHIGMNKEDKIEYNLQKEVDYVNGACILAKRELIEKIGLLSTEFFLYWEENDLCFRAKNSGFKVVFVPGALIWHKTAASIKNLKGLEQYYMVRNRFIFMKKYASKPQLLSFFLYFFMYEFVYLSILNIIYAKNKTAFFKGVRDGLKYIIG